jgi:hypothetical protein
MNTTRTRLPNRRETETLGFKHRGNSFTLTIGRWSDGRLAEIFISSEKPGSELEAIARDAAITASLAFQFGCPLNMLRAALTQDHGGGPATLLGAALDSIEGAAR